MPILVRNVKLELEEDEDCLAERVAAKLRVPRSAIRALAPVRRSLDARRRGHISVVYSVEVALDEPPGAEVHIVQRLHRDDIAMLLREELPDSTPGTAPMWQRPIVVGFGPAGMFAAWKLAELGYRPIVLERGRGVRIRHKDIMQKFYREGLFNPESNLLYGEGGAGAYSDGKLYTRLNDAHVDVVLQTFYHHGADPAILVDARPHIGSDKLPSICMRMRESIEAQGGEVHFECRVEGLQLDDEGHVCGLRTADAEWKTRHLIMAIGHSARDTLRMLHNCAVKLAAKSFQLGVRIEHPQSLVDDWQYGALAGHERLPPAHYQIVAKRAASSLGNLFSFCMCPGGMVLPTNESPGLIVTNGASRSSRRGTFANSGLVITIPPGEFGGDPLAGLAYQQRWEQQAFEAGGGSYAVPAQRASDYLADRMSDGLLDTSYPFGGRWCHLRALLPEHFAASLVNGLHSIGRRLRGFAGAEGIIMAPETRASSPVRIVRHPQTLESVSVRGLYPVGEGAGYAGGIVSAAIDGLKTAEEIIRNWGPPN